MALLGVVCFVFLMPLGYLVYSSNAKPTLPRPVPEYKVAIVGAGPAGIAAAQYLCTSPTARKVRFNITIYESKPVIGGVLAINDNEGSPVRPKDDPMQDPITAEDVTGKALIWNNALFTRDSERFLKDRINFSELGPEQIGYYKNAVKIASATRPSRETPIMKWLVLLWSYGSSVWRGAELAEHGTLRAEILKTPLIPNVENIFASLSVLGFLRQPARSMLRDRGISDRYANEILEPQVQRAYGQNLNQVTGLAAMMAAAWQEYANVYQGGNLIDRLQQILDQLDIDIRTSTRVTEVKNVELSQGHPAWLIRHENADGGGGAANASIEGFDKVIMAAADFNVQLESGDERMLNLIRRYDINANAMKAAPVHVTFFTSPTKLAPWDHDEDQVLFLEAWRAAGMRELALVRDIITYDDDNNVVVEHMYRVLSGSPVLRGLQTRTKITWSYETRIERAYPVTTPLQRFPPFELPQAKGFWWTSVIQRAGTSVDLNWLAGKVVAEDLIKEVTKG